MDKPTDEDDLKEILLLENASPRRKSEHDFPCISSMEKPIMVVAPWTIKERNTLFKAIQEETTVASKKIKRIRLDESTREPLWKPDENMKTRKSLLANDCDELVVPLQEKDVDWFKISSIHFEEVHSPLDCRVMWNVFLHPRINKNSWTKLEDVKLKEITKKYKLQNWDRIAAELNTNRSAYQCFIRCNTIRKLPKVKNCTWKQKEDDKLLKLVKIFQIGDFIPWGEVASWMQNRTKQQVYFRWTYSLAPYLTKGRFSKSEDNLLRDAVAKYDYSKDKNNEIRQEKRNEESDGSNRMHRFNRTQPNKDRKDHNEDIDKELIKYFHTEEAIEKSLYHGQQSCTSDKLECNVKKLYSILRQLNAELCIPENAFNNSMLHDSHRQLLGSLKEYTDKKNNKKRQHMIIDKYSLLMFGVNHTYIAERASDDIKFSNRTGCIDYRVNAKSTFLVEKTSVFDTPDVVISHIGGNEQELEFEKLARLLVQSSSSKDKQSVQATESKGVYAFPSRMSLDQNYSATNNRDNDNRGSLNCNESTSMRANVLGRINRSASCPQSKNTIRNITLFETIREFTSASPAETSKDQYIPAIETTHSTLFSFKRLLGLKSSSNEEHNNPQKFLTMSTRCQRSFNLLETRLEQLFKYPIGLSRTTLPEVYVMDTFSYDDVTSKRKASEPPTIPKPCKTRKCQIFDKSNKDDN